MAAATTEEAAAEEEAESKEGFRTATAKEQIDHRRNLEEKRKVELEKRTSARVHAAAGEMSQAVLRAKATKAAKAAAKAELVEAQAKAAAAAAAARATRRCCALTGRRRQGRTASVTPHSPRKIRARGTPP